MKKQRRVSALLPTIQPWKFISRIREFLVEGLFLNEVVNIVNPFKERIQCLWRAVVPAEIYSTSKHVDADASILAILHPTDMIADGERDVL